MTSPTDNAPKQPFQFLEKTPDTAKKKIGPFLGKHKEMKEEDPEIKEKVGLQTSKTPTQTSNNPDYIPFPKKNRSKRQGVLIRAGTETTKRKETPPPQSTSKRASPMSTSSEEGSLEEKVITSPRSQHIESKTDEIGVILKPIREITDRERRKELSKGIDEGFELLRNKKQIDKFLKSDSTEKLLQMYEVIYLDKSYETYPVKHLEAAKEKMEDFMRENNIQVPNKESVQKQFTKQKNTNKKY